MRLFVYVIHLKCQKLKKKIINLKYEKRFKSQSRLCALGYVKKKIILIISYRFADIQLHLNNLADAMRGFTLTFLSCIICVLNV